MPCSGDCGLVPGRGVDFEGVGHQNLDRCPELAVFATSDHDRPWPSPSVTSACSDPLGGPRRTRTSNHGAPPPGAYPRAPTQCARRLPPCGSGDPRRPLPDAGAMALALLPRHARDAPLLAPRALEAQMAALAIHAWPWSAAHVR